MGIPFLHPSGESLLEMVRNVFKDKDVYQTKSRHIIFLCGGSIAPRSKSMRRNFLSYSKKALPEFRFFLAEAATQDITNHNEPEFINIADFESLVADISDCIILFPESPGSFAEIGFFANSKAIEKLLVANDIRKQNDSFINTGIIDKINSKSAFRQIIMLDYKRPNFQLINDRLHDRLPTRTAKKFDFKEFSALPKAQQLYIIFHFVVIFRVINLESLTYCLNTVFGSAKQKIVKYLLSILIATNYVNRIDTDSDYFSPSQSAHPFLEFRNFDINDLQSRIVSFYQKNAPESYKLLSRIIV